MQYMYEIIKQASILKNNYQAFWRLRQDPSCRQQSISEYAIKVSSMSPPFWAHFICDLFRARAWHHYPGSFLNTESTPASSVASGISEVIRKLWALCFVNNFFRHWFLLRCRRRLRRKPISSMWGRIASLCYSVLVRGIWDRPSRNFHWMWTITCPQNTMIKDVTGTKVHGTKLFLMSFGVDQRSCDSCRQGWSNAVLRNM